MPPDRRPPPRGPSGRQPARSSGAAEEQLGGVLADHLEALGEEGGWTNPPQDDAVGDDDATMHEVAEGQDMGVPEDESDVEARDPE